MVVQHDGHGSGFEDPSELPDGDFDSYATDGVEAGDQ